MPIEFIGSLVNGSAANFRPGGYDSGYPARMARLHEEAGFDRLLVGHSSGSPDGFTVADRPVATDLITQFNPAVPDHDAAIRALELIATEVAPALGWKPSAGT